MNKDVMIRLDGGSGDDARLAAATQIAEIFQSLITGLFFNVVPDEFNGANVNQAAQAPDAARRAGDAVETMLFQRLTQLQQPTNLRRFDVAGVLDISETALPVVRTADTFVALRPNDRSNEPEELIKNLLFGTGRHLFLVPNDWKGFTPLDNIVVAWNGSSDTAMTGKISLRGLVLPIGGVKEKVLAAIQAGITTVMLRARNRKDIEDIPENARDRIRFVWLERVDDAIEAALNPPKVSEPDLSRTTHTATTEKRVARSR